MPYRDSGSRDAVLVRELATYCGLDYVLYIDFNPEGKLTVPDAEALAKAAIGSLARAPVGKDGISYLAAMIDDGVLTPLTPAYRGKILAVSGCSDLGDAIRH